MTDRPAHWPVEVDGMSNCGVAIEIDHSKIHDATSFAVSAKATPAASAALVLAFKTPAAGPLIHLFVTWVTEASGTMEIIEGPSWTTDTGTLTPIYCRNRETPGTSTVEEDKTATPAFSATGNVLKDPTGLTGGTVINTQTSWADKKSGGGTRGLLEFVLAAGTTYAIRLTNNDVAAKGVELGLDYYENGAAA